VAPRSISTRVVSGYVAPEKLSAFRVREGARAGSARLTASVCGRRYDRDNYRLDLGVAGEIMVQWEMGYTRLGVGGFINICLLLMLIHGFIYGQERDWSVNE